jgi:hypothetical protein
MPKFDNLKIYLLALKMNFPTIFLTLHMRILNWSSFDFSYCHLHGQK